MKRGWLEGGRLTATTIALIRGEEVEANEHLVAIVPGKPTFKGLERPRKLALDGRQDVLHSLL